MNSILQKRQNLLVICANSKGLSKSENPTECLQAVNRYSQCATCLNAQWYHERSGRVQCLCPIYLKTTVSADEEDSKADIYECDRYSDIREFNEDEE